MFHCPYLVAPPREIFVDRFVFQGGAKDWFQFVKTLDCTNGQTTF
jgi:hypothetical protein